MSPAARIVAALVALLLAVAGGFRLGLTFKQGQWDAAQLADAKGRNDAMAEAAREVASQARAFQPIRERIIRETVEKPVFRDCRSGPDAVGLLNAAAGAASDPVAGDRGVPAASSPH